jgi:predicted phage terminase large subunit-like protein
MSAADPKVQAAQRAEIAYTEISAEIARRELREFSKRAWSIIDPQALVWSWSMDAVCDHLYYTLIGDIQNLIVNEPPRMSKSLLGAVFFPAWAWIDHPELQFLTASYDKNLATRDAVKTRHLFSSSWYRERWGDSFALMYDVNQQDRYMNDKRGHRICTSPASRATGEGGNILILDDPHNVIQAESDKVRQSTLYWHDNAWRSRRNNPTKDKRIYIGQRTHDADLFGHLISQAPEEYVVLTLPAEFRKSKVCMTFANANGEGPDKKRQLFKDPRKEEGELLAPTRLSAPFLKQQRKAMAEHSYFAQYQQDTMAGGGVILKANWWREWHFPKGHKFHGAKRPLPRFEEIVQSYDTALEADELEENAFNARTTWGLFWHAPEWWDAELGEMVMEPEEVMCAMILERWEERCLYPDLRKEVIRANKEWEPDLILIEKKASGHALLHELRRAGLPVRGVTISGGRRALDKVARAHFASIVLEKGLVYYVPRNWFYDVRDRCAKFPNVEFSDIVDTVTQALAYLRRKGSLELSDDPKTDIRDMWDTPKRRMGYG